MHTTGETTKKDWKFKTYRLKTKTGRLKYWTSLDTMKIYSLMKWRTIYQRQIKKKRRPYKQTCWEKNEKTIGGKDLKKQTQWEYGKEINSLWVLTRILQKEFEKDLIKKL